MDIEQIHERAEEATVFLKTIAHPERLMVLCQLVEGEAMAGNLLEKSALSQSAFSQHLRILRDKGFVESRKDANHVFYSIADGRVKKLLEAMQEILCR